MRLHLIFVLLILISAFHCPGQDGVITLNIHDVKGTGGQLRIGIFDNPSDFKNKENPAYKKSLLLKDTLVEVIFEHVAKGQYAIAVYHDENNDFQLNQKKLGIPAEGVGFSSVSKSKIKPPDFDLASFHFARDTTIHIHLRYPK
jgi:uncharacterized protein (DUF2141 family)